MCAGFGADKIPIPHTHLTPPPTHTPPNSRREDIEELAGSAAVKEEQIEVKLAAIEAEWATTNLVFAGGPAGGRPGLAWPGAAGTVHCTLASSAQAKRTARSP
jgi:hypothetical protein